MAGVDRPDSEGRGEHASLDIDLGSGILLLLLPPSAKDAASEVSDVQLPPYRLWLSARPAVASMAPLRMFWTACALASISDISQIYFRSL